MFCSLNFSEFARAVKSDFCDLSVVIFVFFFILPLNFYFHQSYFALFVSTIMHHWKKRLVLLTILFHFSPFPKYFHFVSLAKVAHIDLVPEALAGGGQRSYATALVVVALVVKHSWNSYKIINAWSQLCALKSLTYMAFFVDFSYIFPENVLIGMLYAMASLWPGNTKQSQM